MKKFNIPKYSDKVFNNFVTDYQPRTKSWGNNYTILNSLSHLPLRNSYYGKTDKEFIVNYFHKKYPEYNIIKKDYKFVYDISKFSSVPNGMCLLVDRTHEYLYNKKTDHVIDPTWRSIFFNDSGFLRKMYSPYANKIFNSDPLLFINHQDLKDFQNEMAEARNSDPEHCDEDFGYLDIIYKK